MLVKETIASVQAQTYQHWETVVVDDGSTDGSLEILEKMVRQDQRVRLLQRNRLPKGGGVCRNIGAEHAKGEYLIFLDSDDLLAPFCLEQRVKYFKAYPKAEFLVFLMLLFQETPYDSMILWNISTKENDLSRFLRTDGVWQTTCPIYKKAAFFESGGFDESLPFWQDYEFHTRLLIKDYKYLKLYDKALPDCFNRRHRLQSVSQGGFSSEFQLQIKEKVLFSFANLLKENNQLAEDNKNSLMASLFSVAFSWVINFLDDKNVLRIIQGAKQYRLIDGYDYFVATQYLKLLQARLKNRSILLKYIAGFFKILLPKGYVKPQKHMCRMPYKGPDIVEV